MTILRTHATGIADWTHSPYLVVLGTLLVVVAVWLTPVPGRPSREDTP